MNTQKSEPSEPLLALAEMLEHLKDSHYKDLRVLPDGTIIGTIDLMFTRGLVVDLDWNGWGHRYCYKDRSLATVACLALQTGDDQPIPGFVAERHVRARPW